jgi:hypothetical protein
MTYVQGSAGLSVYVDPGTDDDGYVEPEWTVNLNASAWIGGRNSNFYVGQDADNDHPADVWVFKHPDLESVQRLRTFYEERLPHETRPETRPPDRAGQRGGPST